ncbi:hypothetical protein, partial [Aggregatibacter actinomycetemcomitans]
GQVDIWLKFVLERSTAPSFFDEKFYFCDSVSNIHFRRFYTPPISSIVAALRMRKVRLKM